MFISNCIPPASGDVFPVPFRRLIIIFIIGTYAVILPQRFRLEVHCRRRHSLCLTLLQPFIHIFFCTFHRSAFRIFLLNILDEIFYMFPIAFVGIKRKNFFFIRSVFNRLFFTFSKRLHTCQFLIRLLMKSLGVRFIFSSQQKNLLSLLFKCVKAKPPPAGTKSPTFSKSTLF